MNQRLLYIVIAILVVAVIALGFGWYNDRQSTHVGISVDGNGISIDAD